MRQRVVGTGITQKRVTTLVEITAQGVREDRGFALRSSYGGFTQFADDVRDWSGRTLEAAGLPRREGRYVQLKDGSLLDVSGFARADVCQMDLRCAPGKNHPVVRNIEIVVKDAGFGSDTPEGYAATMLACLDRAEKSRAAGRIDSAMEWSLRLGELTAEARMKFRWESHALRGQKISAALTTNQQEANTIRKAEAEAERKVWQAQADDIATRYPSYSKARIAEKVRERLIEQNKRGAVIKVRSVDAISRKITIARKAC